MLRIEQSAQIKVPGISKLSVQLCVDAGLEFAFVHRIFLLAVRSRIDSGVGGRTAMHHCNAAGRAAA